MNAQNSFMAKMGGITVVMDRLRGHVDDHLGVPPEDITWTDAAVAAEVYNKLKDVLDLLEGEENE